MLTKDASSKTTVMLLKGGGGGGRGGRQRDEQVGRNEGMLENFAHSHNAGIQGKEGDVGHTTEENKHQINATHGGDDTTASFQN